ncbi:hypothetical protein Dalk_4406 [Desulfatibacillum aliphaticivorans]|uniref:DUF4124 domain-containing protein n=1 Tax=Desulfatibacillum aliphaticivorans TaxID=218208 RepID=B8FNB6_DESAL|nr:DUF4124 domain-containing protein [Desulfatibacillum aliphaticivorans]ACL06085.1 hypothetical protein Dalk_4406 [Desulfatibacillum aliphaticivorans]
MKLIKALIIAGVIFSLAPCACWAEFYRYKDASGAWVYTDNIMEVPADQRPKTYEGVTDNLSDSEKAKLKAEKAARAAKRRAKRHSFPSTVSSDTDRAYADLKAEEDALTEMGKDLKAEQDALGRLRVEAKTQEERDAINLKMAALNKKIQQYEKQRQDYIKKVDVYNRMLQKKIDD